MENWLIAQDVDLLSGATSLAMWPHVPMFVGDHLGHTWRVRVFRGGVPVAMDGVMVEGHFVRADGNTVLVVGTAAGNELAVTLVQACYAVPGDLQGLFKVAWPGGGKYEISSLMLAVGAGPSGSYVDPGDVIPSLSELFALMDEMQAAMEAAQGATGSANTAAGSANAAATKANTAAGAADASAGAAGAAAERANAAAEGTEAAIRAAQESAADADRARDAALAAKTGADTAAEGARNAAALAGEKAGLADAAAQNTNALYEQVKADYENGAFDGEAATIALLDTVHEPPLSDPWFEEAQGSTERNRLYIPHLPAGLIQYATFFVDLDTGQLCMVAPPGLEGLTFSINDETGNLEVWINAG